MLRDRDFNTAWHAASDGTLEQRRYYCQNWRADVVAVLTEAGVQDERVAYSAYGVPFGMPAGDTDSDGDFDTNDQGAIAFWESLTIYDVRGDVNLDGSVTSADSAAATTESLGWEVLSGIDSRKGYAGYEHAPELAGTTYHVRHRVLKADLGRWLTRDPLGYVDGMSLYGYVQGRAVVQADPWGLLCGIAGCGSSGQTTAPPPTTTPPVRPSPVTPGPLWTPDPKPCPTPRAPVRPLTCHPVGLYVLCCWYTAEGAYKCGEKLSPRIFPPIEPDPVPPPRYPPWDRKRCSEDTFNKLSAMVDRDCKRAGVTGACRRKMDCDTLLRLEAANRQCAKSRKRVQLCYKPKDRDAGHKNEIARNEGMANYCRLLASENGCFGSVAMD